MSFNLLDEPWIPALLLDGNVTDLSLREIFAQANTIRRISADLPTQSFAVLRLLLAIHHDAVGFHSTYDVAGALRDGMDHRAIDNYLDRYADRFDLFDEHRPFMQVSTLRTAKDEIAGLERLISDVPNNEPFLTVRGGSSLRRISPGEAALWLVHCQAFDPSGIKSAAVGDPHTSGGKGYPIGTSWSGQLGGVVLHGRTLAETLVYNIVPTVENPADRPVWALDAPQSEQRMFSSDKDWRPEPAGPVALLVWQSRRIRLVGDASGVTGVVLAQGDKMTPQNRQAVEHMTAWRYSRPQSKKLGIPTYMPQKHDPTRAGWRGMPALISDSPNREDGVDSSLQPATVASIAAHSNTFVHLDTEVVLELVGMDYGPQEATVADLVHDMLDLRLSVLGEDATEVHLLVYEATDLADDCVRLVGRMAGNLASASGDFEGVEGARSRATAEAWSAIDAPARRWLSKLSSDSDVSAARREWQQILRQHLEPVANRIASSASPAAVTGRQTKFGFMTAAKAENFFRSTFGKKLPFAYPNVTDKDGKE